MGATLTKSGKVGSQSSTGYYKGYEIIARPNYDNKYYWFEILTDDPENKSLYVSHWEDQHKTTESAIGGGKVIIDQYPDRLCH